MKAVLWDLDDTLIETLPGRMRALRHAYELCVGGWVDPAALWRSHRGGTLEALGQRLLGDDYLTFTRAYRDYYYNQVNRAPAYEGITDALYSCRDAGLMLAVVTSKVSWGAVEELDAAGLLEHFAAIVGCDDTDQHKPDPEPVYAAMTRLLVDDPDDVVFVGDSPADIFAARNAGVTSIAAMWGALDRELTLDAVPAHVAQAPAEVINTLRTLHEAKVARR